MKYRFPTDTTNTFCSSGDESMMLLFLLSNLYSRDQNHVLVSITIRGMAHNTLCTTISIVL
jgi:hypothetical protein